MQIPHKFASSNTIHSIGTSSLVIKKKRKFQCFCDKNDMAINNASCNTYWPSMENFASSSKKEKWGSEKNRKV